MRRTTHYLRREPRVKPFTASNSFFARKQVTFSVVKFHLNFVRISKDFGDCAFEKPVRSKPLAKPLPHQQIERNLGPRRCGAGAALIRVIFGAAGTAAASPGSVASSVVRGKS